MSQETSSRVDSVAHDLGDVHQVSALNLQTSITMFERSVKNYEDSLRMYQLAQDIAANPRDADMIKFLHQCVDLPLDDEGNILLQARELLNSLKAQVPPTHKKRSSNSFATAIEMLQCCAECGICGVCKYMLRVLKDHVTRCPNFVALAELKSAKA